MNLTNFHQTPIARVVESVRREASRYGVSILHSELVGLIPQDALIESAVWYTQLDEFKTDQILESRLYEVMRENTGQSVNQDADFLDRLASADPTPGGGSAAAYTAAAAAALVTMVARVTIGKKKYASVQEQMLTLVERAEELRKRLTTAVSEDAESFESYLTATRLPKESPEDMELRANAMDAATKNAAIVPFNVAKMCIEVLKLAEIAAQLGNLNAISDAASAGYLCDAALKSAITNVKINIKSLRNPLDLSNISDGSSAFLNQATESVLQIRNHLSTRAGL
jgi:glutamate formiminotransferase/formiminotetrahydrofolate cyclodeaminase